MPYAKQPAIQFPTRVCAVCWLVNPSSEFECALSRCPRRLATVRDRAALEALARGPRLGAKRL